MAAKKTLEQQPWTETEAGEAWPITRRAAEMRGLFAADLAAEQRLRAIEARERELLGIAPMSAPDSAELAMARPSFRERELRRQAREDLEAGRARELEAATPSAYERLAGVPLPESARLRPFGSSSSRPTTAWEGVKDRILAGASPEEYAILNASPPLLEEPASSGFEYEPGVSSSFFAPRTERTPSSAAATERGGYVPPSVLAASRAPVTTRTAVSPLSPVAPEQIARTASSSDVPKYVRQARAQGAKAVESKPWKAEEHACKRQTLIRALEATGGNKRAAARNMGMTRDGFYKALARVGLPTAGHVI